MSTTPTSSGHEPDELYPDPTAAAWPQPFPASSEPPLVPPALSPYPSQEQVQQQHGGGHVVPPPVPYGQDGPPAYEQPGYPGYGQPGYAGYGQPPYGQPGYPQTAPGYGYPPPGLVSYAQNRTNGSALTLLILSLVMVLFCVELFLIPAAVFAGIALSRQNTDPQSSATMARRGWIAFAIGIAAPILIFVLWLVSVGR